MAKLLCTSQPLYPNPLSPFPFASFPPHQFPWEMSKILAEYWTELKFLYVRLVKVPLGKPNLSWHVEYVNCFMAPKESIVRSPPLRLTPTPLAQHSGLKDSSKLGENVNGINKKENIATFHWFLFFILWQANIFPFTFHVIFVYIWIHTYYYY